MREYQITLNSSPLEMRPLREQIYDYLRSEIQMGRLKPGEFIKLNAISERLGVSKTPLRDALIQLECKGFVQILPRRGVLVNRLSLNEVKNLLEVVGALESSVLVTVFDRIKKKHLKKMSTINNKLRRLMKRERRKGFDQEYFNLNITFHDIFLNLSDNTALSEIILPIKQRLYDLPQRTYDAEWELTNCDEHDTLIELIEKGAAEEAARLWRQSHWSFKAHERAIRKFYAQQDNGL